MSAPEQTKWDAVTFGRRKGRAPSSPIFTRLPSSTSKDWGGGGESSTAERYPRVVLPSKVWRTTILSGFPKLLCRSGYWAI